MLRVVLAALLWTAGIGAAPAQDAYPNRLVKIIVPSFAGSTTDAIGRLLAELLSEKWDKPVIVENNSRGGAFLGTAEAFHAAPDGYTLLVSAPAPLTYNHLIYSDLPYDPTRFTPVALLASSPNVLVMRKDFPATSVRELIDHAKLRPGAVKFASQGVGTTPHLTGILLETAAGIKMLHVPYRGASAALNDVAGGHIDLFFTTLATSLPLYETRQVKILATGALDRDPAIPEVPTMAEAGLPGFFSTTWFALVGPPDLPETLAQKINRDVADIMTQARLKSGLNRLGLAPMTGSPTDAKRFFAEEAKLWGRIVKDNRIKVE